VLPLNPSVLLLLVCYYPILYMLLSFPVTCMFPHVPSPEGLMSDPGLRDCVHNVV
jgi:hypothetical protein